MAAATVPSLPLTAHCPPRAGEEIAHRVAYDDANESLVRPDGVAAVLARLGVAAQRRGGVPQFSGGDPWDALMAVGQASLVVAGGGGKDGEDGDAKPAPLPIPLGWDASSARDWWRRFAFGKTFVERRSLLTVYRAFFRVWACWCAPARAAAGPLLALCPREGHQHRHAPLALMPPLKPCAGCWNSMSWQCCSGEEATTTRCPVPSSLTPSSAYWSNSLVPGRSGRQVGTRGRWAVQGGRRWGLRGCASRQRCRPVPPPLAPQCPACACWVRLSGVAMPGASCSGWPLMRCCTWR